MDKKTKALRLALVYVEGFLSIFDSESRRDPATESDRNEILEDITFIKEALAQQPETPKEN